MAYQIKLPQFEGPFDLLLFFIERDELDIYDIPISKITDDFLDYLENLKGSNIDIASEFILVAATLMRIKSKMLLPRKELNDEGEEIDPREELVARILEYKRFKSVLSHLQDLEKTRQSQVERGNIDLELRDISNLFSAEHDLESINLFKLMKAFEKALGRIENRKEVRHEVAKHPYTIKSQKALIIKTLENKGLLNFDAIFGEIKSKIEAIYTFLAILELVQLKEIKIQIGVKENSFNLSLGNLEEAS